jgi:hypothetical protein
MHRSAGDVRDVGTIDLDGGAVIEGVVIDGVTGDPEDEAPLMAWRTADAGGRGTPTLAESDADGSFRFEGLPGGEWTIAPALAPQQSVTVTVAEGGTRTGVRVVTSDATALTQNGFELEEDEEGLVVADVTPESPADDAGLVPGDVVTGVRIAGFDVSSALGEYDATFTRLVLGHWDGPGVTLVVEGEDGEELVPLDW